MSNVIYQFCSFSGWINGAKTLDKHSKVVAVMMFVSGALFTVISLLSIFLLRKVLIHLFLLMNMLVRNK